MIEFVNKCILYEIQKHVDENKKINNETKKAQVVSFFIPSKF
jgi:hypothetical protein